MTNLWELRRWSRPRRRSIGHLQSLECLTTNCDRVYLSTKSARCELILEIPAQTVGPLLWRRGVNLAYYTNHCAWHRQWKRESLTMFGHWKGSLNRRDRVRPISNSPVCRNKAQNTAFIPPKSRSCFMNLDGIILSHAVQRGCVSQMHVETLR